jgi:hypothetical protein
MINRKNLKLFIMIMWARSEELVRGIEMAIQGKNVAVWVNLAAKYRFL